MATTTPRAGRSPEDPAGTAGAAFAATQHPLPWHNSPAGGENHVTDARGGTVYKGCDASEMFRLLAAATAQTEPTRRHPRASRRLFRRHRSTIRRETA